MQTGDSVFVLFVSDDGQKVWVTEHRVLDGENRVVKSVKYGEARVLHNWEQTFPAEAEAWQRAAQELLAMAASLRIKAEECLQKAAAGRVVRVSA